MEQAFALNRHLRSSNLHFSLYHALAARVYEIHLFTVPPDRKPHLDAHEGNLHVYFAANDHGLVNCSLGI